MKNNDKEKIKNKEILEALDSMDQLPLSIVSIESLTLRHARLVKNSRLETILELYNDELTGSTQIGVDDDSFLKAFPTASESLKKDQQIIQKIAELHSFDVYSLRSTLRKMGLDVVDEDVLILSKDMQNTLKKYTVEFISPLIYQIFGAADDSKNIVDTGELRSIFRNSDSSIVKNNLTILSQKTGIEIVDLPQFLEDYSDVLLSVAYYRYSYENIMIEIERFIHWLMEIKSHRDIKKAPQTYSSCLNVQDILSFILKSLRERFDRFYSSFETFWEDINERSFTVLQEEIQRNHATMGAVLCGLSVKMKMWSEAFPNNDIGSPKSRAGFIVTDLEPGIRNLRLLEETARVGLGLDRVNIEENKGGL